jgi:flavin reductase (DIM6/NTAB) family NADH-FMN oxidoreductase RutF
MIYPIPAVIVTCGDKEENFNAITIAWTGTICTNPPMTYISVRPSRHSYKIIERTGEFVINLTTEELAFATDYCGVRSGSNEDKIKKCNLTLEKGTVVNAPVIKESPVNIECRVTEIKKLGSHDMFIAEVVAVSVDDKYLDEDDKFHLDASKPIAYSHGNYFKMGEQIGKFGYSVAKKKTGKNKNKNKKK